MRSLRRSQSEQPIVAHSRDVTVQLHAIDGYHDDQFSAQTRRGRRGCRLQDIISANVKFEAMFLSASPREAVAIYFLSVV